jgi:hypothetical protein
MGGFQVPSAEHRARGHFWKEQAQIALANTTFVVSGVPEF